MRGRFFERSVDVLMEKTMMSKQSSTHSFVLVLDGFDRPEAEIEDSLFEAGCDDALLSFRGTTPFLEFDREAQSLEEAVLSAIQNVETAHVGATVLRVEPDDLVSASEIARRTSSSRETVRLWHEGERGPGTFPPPVASVGIRTILWSWAEVSVWLLREGKLEDERIVQEARLLAMINALLNQERYGPVVQTTTRAIRERLGKTGALTRLRSLAESVRGVDNDLWGQDYPLDT